MLKSPLVFDGRNLYEPEVMQEAGFRYFAVGRSLRGPVQSAAVAGSGPARELLEHRPIDAARSSP